MNTTGLIGWLRDNAVPIVILVIGIGLLMSSRKGDSSKVVLTIGLTVAALAVVAIALQPTMGINVGRWAIGLLGIV